MREELKKKLKKGEGLFRLRHSILEVYGLCLTVQELAR